MTQEALQPGGGRGQQTAKTGAPSVRRYTATEASRGNTFGVNTDDDSIQQTDAADEQNSLVNTHWVPRSRYKRQQNNIKKQNITVVFNISNMILTEAMDKVLNRGLNFSVLQNNIDVTQLLVDWKRFSRTMIWKEWWFGRNSEEVNETPIF